MKKILVLFIILTLSSCGATAPVLAAGWGWFVKHVRPSGKCQNEIVASYYNQGTKTASGERFNPHALTAAHRHLPFGSHVTLTNPHNGKTVTVRINDRGPYIKGIPSNKAIDLTPAAFKQLGLRSSAYVCQS